MGRCTCTMQNRDLDCPIHGDGLDIYSELRELRRENKKLREILESVRDVEQIHELLTHMRVAQRALENVAAVRRVREESE